MTITTVVPDSISLRRVAGLAVPALGVLAAEPLYVLVDTAMVGHLGALPLAGLALGGTVFSTVTSQLTFLTYGTTAKVARLFGAGRRMQAVEVGVVASWLAVAIGVLVLVVGEVLAGPICALLSGNPHVAAAATSWLRIALFGAPLVLLTMAGNGWMRGVQDTARPLKYVLLGNLISAVLNPILINVAGLGLQGSAFANLCGQGVSATLFVAALISEKVHWRAQWRQVRAQLTVGRDLIVRSLSFQVCFVSASAVASRFGVTSVAAHQIAWQLWMFLSLVLDAIAIAAQAIVGEQLGAGNAPGAKKVAYAVARYGAYLGFALTVLLSIGYAFIGEVFTNDAQVLQKLHGIWWIFVAQQTVAGVVFAIDGALLGAGDAAYLRNVTIAAAVGGYLPIIWLSLVFHWGLTGIWCGLSAMIIIRAVGVIIRLQSDKWAVTGIA